MVKLQFAILLEAIIYVTIRTLHQHKYRVNKWLNLNPQKSDISMSHRNFLQNKFYDLY